jgi:tRNA(Ile)-lysidine synthase
VRLDTQSIARVFDRRLDRGGDRPLAVALSGGGDSLALLLLAKSWADRAGRPLIAFTVDHGLQADSGAWTAWCVARTARLGVGCEILVWAGPRPERGLSAAARGARHRLIANAARDAGARVVLFGHTADDILEARLMQAGGVRIPEPIVWSPSPVWPEGREVFMFRPLLDARRAAIRAWLTDQGETWIEDPANADSRHPRARARLVAADLTFEARPAASHALGCGMTVGPAGDIAFRPQNERHGRALGAAIACVSGAEKPPRRDALERLTRRLGADERAETTLGGARILAGAGQVIIARETADGRGRGCPSLTLQSGVTVVWDGRFEAQPIVGGLTLAALRGHAARLDRTLREQLTSLHPAVRGALPALIDPSGAVTLPSLEPDRRIKLRNLVPGRLAGASGAIDKEALVGVYG